MKGKREKRKEKSPELSYVYMHHEDRSFIVIAWHWQAGGTNNAFRRSTSNVPSPGTATVVYGDVSRVYSSKQKNIHPIRRVRSTSIPSNNSSVHTIISLERITVVVVVVILVPTILLLNTLLPNINTNLPLLFLPDSLSERRDDEAPDTERDTESGTDADADAGDDNAEPEPVTKGPPIIAWVIVRVFKPNNPGAT